ncbi:MAG: proton-conducting transporter membrane subunit [Prochlorococcus sp.]
MSSLILAWLVLPLAAAFLAALFTKTGRWLAIAIPLTSVCLTIWLQLNPSELPLLLMDSPGVALNLKTSQLGFLLLNGLVCSAVVLQIGSKPRHKLTWVLMLILHGALNSVYLAADLMSIYVAIELVAVTAFLLMIDLERRATLWVAFRYLILGDLAMILYDFGALLAYHTSGDFSLDAQAQFTSVTISLLVVGLLFKTGAFLTGFWLPLTHATAPTEVSALLSSLVVTAGAAPLARLASQSGETALLLMVFGAISLVIGVIAALVQTDIKRMLAWSTISQMGYVLLAPASAGLYALAHGLGKAALFLLAGRLPSRELARLQEGQMNWTLGIPIGLASLSLIGMPGSIGYSAKALLSGSIDPALANVVNWSGVGTAMVFARFLPNSNHSATLSLEQSRDSGDQPQSQPSAAAGLGTWLLIAAIPALPWLLGSKSGSPEAFATSLLILGLGIGVERCLRGAIWGWTPPDFERFVDVIVAVGVTLLCSQLILWQLPSP